MGLVQNLVGTLKDPHCLEIQLVAQARGTWAFPKYTQVPLKNTFFSHTLKGNGIKFILFYGVKLVYLI